MRVLLQRVTRASVTIDGDVVGRIGTGLLLFVGITEADGDPQIELLANKIVNLRIFEDDEDRMNRSLLDVLGLDDRREDGPTGVLVVSQFTLYADTRKGRRPSFVGAAAPAIAAPLVERFAEKLADLGVPVHQGRFGADMAVELINDGPVTIWLDSDELQRPRNDETRA